MGLLRREAGLTVHPRVSTDSYVLFRAWNLRFNSRLNSETQACSQRLYCDISRTLVPAMLTLDRSFVPCPSS